MSPSKKRARSSVGSPGQRKLTIGTLRRIAKPPQSPEVARAMELARKKGIAGRLKKRVLRGQMSQSPKPVPAGPPTSFPPPAGGVHGPPKLTIERIRELGAMSTTPPHPTVAKARDYMRERDVAKRIRGEVLQRGLTPPKQPKPRR